MMSENFDDALRTLADDAGRAGRLDAAADLRRRGTARRTRRHAATATLGAVLVGLVTVGIAVAGTRTGTPVGPAESSPAAPRSSSAPSTGTPSNGTPSSGPPSSGPPSSPAGVGDPLLAGTREVTIVREQAPEGGVSLVDGRLVEADDDSGRQLFVPTPVGGGRYLVKSYVSANDHPAADEPSCWQAHNAGTGEPLTIQGAVCDANDSQQWFTITPRDNQTYAISNDSAYLRHSPTFGLILEELGDAPLTTTFRFVDNGPARTPAGG